jgi:hypothetical protein
MGPNRSEEAQIIRNTDDARVNSFFLSFSLSFTPRATLLVVEVVLYSVNGEKAAKRVSLFTYCHDLISDDSCFA